MRQRLMRPAAVSAVVLVVLVSSIVAMTQGNPPAQQRRSPVGLGGHSIPADPSFRSALRPAGEADRQARMLLWEGDLDGAEAQARRALAIAPAPAGPRADSRPFTREARRVLGRILVRQGKYREGLPMLLAGHRNVVGNGNDPDIAIAYCRLGDYANARRFCSGGGLIPPSWKGMPVEKDVPGTATLAAVEAGALLARGLEALGTTQRMLAHRDFLAAERLAPRNVYVAYVLGRSFLHDLHDGREAWPRYRLVAAKGHEPIRTEASRQARSLEGWFRLHPEEAPTGYVARAR